MNYVIKYQLFQSKFCWYVLVLMLFSNSNWNYLPIIQWRRCMVCLEHLFLFIRQCWSKLFRRFVACCLGKVQEMFLVRSKSCFLPLVTQRCCIHVNSFGVVVLFVMIELPVRRPLNGSKCKRWNHPLGYRLLITEKHTKVPFYDVIKTFVAKAVCLSPDVAVVSVIAGKLRIYINTHRFPPYVTHKY